MTQRRRTPILARRMASLCAVATTAALLAGCGGGAKAPASADANATTTLTVGYIPIVDCAPLFLGIKMGFFAKQHLKIKPVVASGGAAIVPAVQSGSDDIGFSNTVSLLVANKQGLPLKIVGLGAAGGNSAATDYSALLVKPSITSAKQLDGTTIAVNDLNSIASLSNDVALAKLGANPATFKYTEIGFPDMAEALQQGRVAATWVVEPFATIGESMGQKELTAPFAATDQDLAVAEWFVTDKYLSSNPSVAKRFYTAITESNTYAQDHPAAVRQIVTSYTTLSKSLAGKIHLPTWGPTINKASVSRLNTLAQKYGFFKGSANVSQLYASFLH